MLACSTVVPFRGLGNDFVATFGLDAVASGVYNGNSGFLVLPLVTFETRFRGVSSHTQD
ncbi:hypothetical protein HanXRQr2_Chr16g0744191 [Helianthus annuus]|uniref:Uncharacterized protein n=1 Tax=Helianthus annuus TaxID=4232 RepID=A0A251TCI6_HELAN|nr:hypothetical protein HanXRQr2_Chr16g0744191 [Helianthus annuus]KAJ0820900.1 hypothetical protein HanPSC8_Chr16g0713541 [Helianthus annuus]